MNRYQRRRLEIERILDALIRLGRERRSRSGLSQAWRSPDANWLTGDEIRRFDLLLKERIELIRKIRSCASAGPSLIHSNDAQRTDRSFQAERTDDRPNCRSGSMDYLDDANSKSADSVGTSDGSLEHNRMRQPGESNPRITEQNFERRARLVLNIALRRLGLSIQLRGPSSVCRAIALVNSMPESVETLRALDALQVAKTGYERNKFCLISVKTIEDLCSIG